MISGILAALKLLPQLIDLFKEIIAFIADQIDTIEKKKKISELKEGLKIARETGNTSNLENLFRGKP